MIDLLLVTPSSRDRVYQGLGNDIAAIEPPVWSGLIGTFIRNHGHSVAILDAEAEGLGYQETANRIHSYGASLVVFVVYGQQPSASTQCMHSSRHTALALSLLSKTKTAVMGTHASALPKKTLIEEPYDFVIEGEGPYTILGLLEKKPFADIPGLHYRDEKNETQSNPRAPNVQDLDATIPRQSWDLLDMSKYRAHNWHSFGISSGRQPYVSIQTSLGCAFSCLTGDTLVNTIYGKIAIEELVEKYDTIPVYTYDPKTRKVFISDAINIQKYGSNEKLVRVHFTDGTHIDCTPDHRFLQFKWGNGRGVKSSKSREWECEAKDLPKGAHVRAVKEEVNAYGRPQIRWARKGNKTRARLVMEYKLGRELTRKEQVHHIDHDVTNDHPDNLKYYASGAEHLRAEHSEEFAKRMRDNNPAKNMTPEWREKLRKAITGKKRSLESRLRYRESKLGDKNPNFKHGERIDTGSRIKEINHVVARVEHLKKRADVYCVTVPATGWFFANDVLVKNCSFCCIQAPFGKPGMRYWSAENVVNQISEAVEKYGVKNIKFPDEMFFMNRKHVEAICDLIIERKLDLNIWAYARIDTVIADLLPKMKKAGFRWFILGIESGSKFVRDGVTKGRFTDDKITKTVRQIQDAGIYVMGNYIFGLPDDTLDSMTDTLNMAIELNTEWANFYSAMAYPGSKLYTQAVKEGWPLPSDWIGFSQHAYETLPLPTKTLTGPEVLAFRDKAHQKYFSSDKYLNMIMEKFGMDVVREIQKTMSIKLERKYLPHDPLKDAV